MLCPLGPLLGVLPPGPCVSLVTAAATLTLNRPSGHSSLSLKDKACSYPDSSFGPFLACQNPGGLTVFCILSCYCPLQSKLAVFLLRWLIGSTNHITNVFPKSCPAILWCSLQNILSHFFAQDKLRIFQILKFWFLFCLIIPSSVYLHIQLYSEVLGVRTST